MESSELDNKRVLNGSNATLYTGPEWPNSVRHVSLSFSSIILTNTSPVNINNMITFICFKQIIKYKLYITLSDLTMNSLKRRNPYILVSF